MIKCFEMAKRSGELLLNNKTSKKQKLEDHDETLWDDDLDDNCFDEIANKILEKDDIVQQSQQNSSTLLSYDSFKPNIPFASTQNFISTPHNVFKKPQPISNTEDVTMKLTYLQQKCEAKEGEVSILRAQIKKMKSDMVEDLSKKQKEYIEITNMKEKEIKSIKGQLDFKDLEIVNLKQKISEISRTNLSISSVYEHNKKQRIESPSRSNITHDDKEKTLKVVKETGKDVHTSILLEPEYIAHSKDLFDFFDSSTPEIHVVETRVTQFVKNTIPYLHNQLVQEELTIPPGPKLSACINNRNISLEDIYSEVFALFQSNVTDINAEDKKETINKLLSISIQLMKHFMQYLDQLENVYRTEDIEQLDRIFIQQNSKECDNAEKKHDINCEIGVRVGRTIKVVAALLPYNEYMKDLILFNQNCQENSSYREYLRDLKKKEFYFSLLNDIVRKIFILRKTEVCTTFLNSVAFLLLVVSRENLYHNIFSVFTSLFGSILFTRPPAVVIYKLLVVTKNCAKSKKFLDFLCMKPDGKKFTVDKKRKLNYFSEDTCKFTLFVSLLNNALQDIKEEELSLDITYNVLSFVENVFTSNPYWVHDQQKDKCICLEQLYQLIIEVLYWTLLRFKENKNNRQKNKYISIFKCGIRVFELLFFNSYDSIEKFIDSYSRYKEICKTFLEFEDDLNLTEEVHRLEKLCLFEDVPCVSSSSFELI
ncbi:uncharacterized protein LOC123683788 [Harmonia axyridis]|uniref:uncharacterized protein LOC123683788 n=1 Tax=Harmonia axyridis TaxID=115357 RepID=UPI001E277DE1|nr:uncharacterized protein LOC123683788 [Harmonia axyridis]